MAHAHVESLAGEEKLPLDQGFTVDVDSFDDENERSTDKGQ
jgi:hypothetical protein